MESLLSCETDISLKNFFDNIDNSCKKVKILYSQSKKYLHNISNFFKLLRYLNKKIWIIEKNVLDKNCLVYENISYSLIVFLLDWYIEIM